MPTVTIRRSTTVPDIEPLYKFLVGMEAGGTVAVKVLRHAMIMAVLRRVRATFLDNLQRSLQMTIVTGDDTERTQTVERINMITGNLRRAYGDLDKATLAANNRSMQKARDRIFELRDSMEDKLAAPSKGPSVRSLSSVDAVMRRRSMQVLSLLADPAFLQTGVVDNATMVGMGPFRELDRIQTPSATTRMALRPTDSQYTILWRQLEFGTGAEAVGGGSDWSYGGMILRGSYPMRAIFGNGLGWRNDILKEIEPALDEAMDSMAPIYP